MCTIIRALLPVSHKAAAAQAHRLEACTALDALSEWLEGWMDGWTDGRLDGWMNGWMGGWIKQVYNDSTGNIQLKMYCSIWACRQK